MRTDAKGLRDNCWVCPETRHGNERTGHPRTINTLWLFNIAMENGPFIDGLLVYLLNMVIFHGYVSHNQMVYT